ncbi:MAG: lipopolysaccharide biosynthesis protein [Candidatus Marinimicrobia bacterium]|nr:lipopolysaccharide biosynthesis protein [Candidatus Neomarinimicrobiota bacterium]
MIEKQIIKTFIVQVFSAICGVAVIKIFATLLSKESMGIFVLIRRLVLFGYPIFLFNLQTSLSKFISADEQNSKNYLKATLITFFVNYGVFIFISIIYRNGLVNLIFNDNKYKYLLLPLSAYILSVCIYYITLSYFRGLRKFNYMNLVNLVFWFISLSTVFLLFLLNVKENYIISTYFLLFSLLNIVIIGIIYFKFYRNTKIIYKDYNLIINNRPDVSGFFRYGIFRLPSIFFSAGIFFLPVYFTSKLYGLVETAVVGLIIYIIQVFEIFASALGLVLLPEFSFRAKKYSEEKVKEDFDKIFEVSISIFIPLGLFLFLFMKEIVIIIFNSSYLEYENLFRLSGLFVGFYLTYAICRSILDGLFIKPYTTLVNFIGMITFLVFFLLLKDLKFYGNIYSFIVTIIILFISTLTILKLKLKSYSISYYYLIILIWEFLVFILFYIILKNLNLNKYILLIKIAMSIVVLWMTFALYKKLNLYWINRLCKSNIFNLFLSIKR